MSWSNIHHFRKQKNRWYHPLAWYVLGPCKQRKRRDPTKCLPPKVCRLACHYTPSWLHQIITLFNSRFFGVCVFYFIWKTCLFGIFLPFVFQILFQSSCFQHLVSNFLFQSSCILNNPWNIYIYIYINWLVVFEPIWKNMRQNGNLPQSSGWK